jgi:hypothetical protein
MEVHLCAVAQSGELWHTIRRPEPDTTWFEFGNVKVAVSNTRFGARILAPGPSSPAWRTPRATSFGLS